MTSGRNKRLTNDPLKMLQNYQLAKWHVDKMRGCQNDRLWKWQFVKMICYKKQVVIMTSCHNDKLSIWQVFKMTSCQNDKFSKWQVVKMTVKIIFVLKKQSWYLSKWQVGKTTSCQNDRLTKWQVVKMTVSKLFLSLAIKNGPGTFPATRLISMKTTAKIRKVRPTSIWHQCYKTFFLRNLWVFVPGKPFQSSLIFASKAREDQSEAIFIY